MPNELILNERYERAVIELEQFLTTQLAARRLSDIEIKAQYKNKNYLAGWLIQYDSIKGLTKLNLLVTGNFPFKPPVVALVNAPAVTIYPHLENEGVLCLLPNSTSISPYDPTGVAREVLKSAFNLLEDSFTGNNTEDFRVEFLSYWDKNLTLEGINFVSLFNPGTVSCEVKVWKGKIQYIFGENEASTQKWFVNRYKKSKLTFENAAYIWIPQPLLPSEYPKSNLDLWKLVKERSAGGTTVLEKLATKTPDQIAVIVGSQSELGTCLSGYLLRKPNTHQSDYFKNKSSLNNGFKPKHAPPKIVSARYLQSSGSIGRLGVERADAAWVHGRGEDEMQMNLSQKKIIIMGCGSIGGFVAKLMATAGVGEIILIDPETLSRANTGRHFLGAKYVGDFKAEKLAEEFKENYPHLKFDSRKEKWSVIAGKEPELLTSADLLISAIGDWSAESMLNEWHQLQSSQPPILYGWTEAYALAGHAVAIFKGSGCFQCQLSQHGSPLVRVTEWNGTSTKKQEPACGVMYQPYGPIELNNTVTLISELALDILLFKIDTSTERIWASRQSLLEASGANWTNDWLALVNNNRDGGISATRKWEKRMDCPVCIGGNL